MVIQVLHGVGEHVYPYSQPDARPERSHEHRQHQVVAHNLCFAPAACQHGADDRAFGFDGGTCQNHKHKRHDDNKDDQQHDPHGLIALDVIECIADALVVFCVDESADNRIVVRQYVQHILFDVRACRQVERLVVERERVVVHLGAAVEAAVGFVGDRRHRERERVEHEAGVVGEKRLVVGIGQDTAYGEGPPVHLHHITNGKTVVLCCEHTVKGDLVGAFRCTARCIGGQVHCGTRAIHACSYVAGPIA